MMFRGSFGEVLLQVCNVLLGVGSLVLVGRGFFVSDGLVGLGLALLMTSLVCFVGFRFGIEQEIHARDAIVTLMQAEPRRLDQAS